jgi:hypothetical protein
VVKSAEIWLAFVRQVSNLGQKMAKIGKKFITLFVISGVCLSVGSYLSATEISDDPLSKSSLVLIVGATFMALGLAALYSGIKSYLHHRAIRRRHEGYERVRVKKRRQARPDP